MAESSEGKGAEAASPQDSAKGAEAPTSKSFKAIVLGATGATGRYLVGELLASKEFKEITLLGRRKFSELPEVFKFDLDKEESTGHLKQIIVDLEQANEENSLTYFEGMDAYFTCFGTTRANAGGNENFRHIDHGYNVKFGEMAKKAGVGFCSLLSSSGAHPRSYVNYLKVKGEIENVFTKLEFPFLTTFKPGLLDRKQRQRFLEKVAGIFMTKMPVDTLAKAIVADALNQLKKERSDDRHSHVLSNHQIFDLAKEYDKSVEAGPEVEASPKKGENNIEAPTEPKSEDVKADEGKFDEGHATEGKSDKGTSDQGKDEEPITSESGKSEVSEDQPKESEEENGETVKDVGSKEDQAGKESDEAVKESGETVKESGEAAKESDQA